MNFRDTLRELKETGQVSVPALGRTFEELTELMGVPAAEALAKKYD